ncbi:MAG: MBL fold metallo-hydrolase [Hyphomonadaceae bacterium]
MKAWGLILSIVMLCGACSTPGASPWMTPAGGNSAAPMRDLDDAFRADAGVNVIRGTFTPGRQPDGNTVVLAASDGLIVFDTGRHPAHTQKIIDYAEAQGRAVAAIFNSHWHLDHNSGNIPLRKRWPSAAVYSNDAALTEALGGFLARGLEANRKMLADPKTSDGLAEDLRGDIATVEQGPLLHPTVSIETPRMLTIGGRKLDIHVAKAASAGDIWIYDSAAKLVMTGDLVTLPAPFLDTACPKAWRAEFDAILATPFVRAIPGHGREMTRTDIIAYRDAFNALIDCAATDVPATACADAWSRAATPLLDSQSGDAGQASAYARYYVESVLRKPGLPARCM